MSDSEPSNIPTPPPLPPPPLLPRSRSDEDLNPTPPPEQPLRTSQSEIHIPTTKSPKVHFENGATPAAASESKKYRTELHIPIDHQPETGPSCSTSNAANTQPEEPLPIDIKNLVQYFEHEIQKETEAAEQSRKEYDDLMKYKKLPRWSTCRGSAACAAALQQKPRSLSPKPISVRLRPSKDRTSIERTTSISKSFAGVPFKTTAALSKIKLSAEEHAASEQDLVHGVVDRSDFEKQLTVAGSKLVIVDFYANWCGPCSNIAPKVDLLAVEHQGRIVFLKVDIELCTSKDLIKEFEVVTLPTFVFFKNSVKIDSFSGANTAEATLKRLIAKYS